MSLDRNGLLINADKESVRKEKGMKVLQRISVLVMSVLFLWVATVVPASAASQYSEIGVTGTPAQTHSVIDKNAIKHRLTLTEENASYLAYDITYTFTVGDPEIEYPTGVSAADIGKAVTGKPGISQIKYNKGTTFTNTDEEGKYYQENNLTFDWSNVKVKQPGIYSWSVSETVTSDANQTVSESLHNGRIKVWVIDDNGELKVNGWFFLNASYKTDIYDTYPAKTATLSFSKEVQGELGSKDRYFYFTVTLTTPNGAATNSYTISGYDSADIVNESMYNSGATQPSGSISLTGGTAGTFYVWLKHGQTVQIHDLPYGTMYTIVESDHTGYRTNGEITNAKSLTEDHTENIININEESPATGINLQTALPVLGTAIAGIMILIALMGKRIRGEKM